MLTLLRPALALTLALTLLTGLAYPLALTGLAQAFLPGPADGSLIRRGDQMVGSALVAQDFTGPAWLHPRASASGYGTTPSGASNLGPTSAALAEAVAARRAAWAADSDAPAPADALTASGSGLDPHVSPENALGQAARIATARGLPVETVRAMIAGLTEPAWLGLYGEARVNVLRFNLALDEAAPVPPSAGN